MVNRLDEVRAAEPERGRAALQEVLGERITLQPDASGRFLWADGNSTAPAGRGASADLVVAGACLPAYMLEVELR
jgi:hypothetical protein